MDWGGNWAWVKLLIPQVMPRKVHFACAHFIVISSTLVSKPPGLGTAQLIISIIWKQGWASQGFTVLADYCPISADHSYFLACLAEPILPNTAQMRGFTPRGERQLAGLSVCYTDTDGRWGWAHSAFSSTVCRGSRQRGSRLCVSNGIPGKRCLTAGLVTTEIAVLSTEYLLALQIFNLVAET